MKKLKFRTCRANHTWQNLERIVLEDQKVLTFYLFLELFLFFFFNLNSYTVGNQKQNTTRKKKTHFAFCLQPPTTHSFLLKLLNYCTFKMIGKGQMARDTFAIKMQWRRLATVFLEKPPSLKSCRSVIVFMFYCSLLICLLFCIAIRLLPRPVLPWENRFLVEKSFICFVCVLWLFQFNSIQAQPCSLASQRAFFVLTSFRTSGCCSTSAWLEAQQCTAISRLRTNDPCTTLRSTGKGRKCLLVSCGFRANCAGKAAAHVAHFEKCDMDSEEAKARHWAWIMKQLATKLQLYALSINTLL